MNKLVNKITSRKFIVTAVIIVAGLAAAFKDSANEKVQIAGYVMAAVAAISYSVIEGTVDKASVKSNVTEAIKGIEGIEIQEVEAEVKEE